jgi:ribosomal-protein-alanine N-acetyltransferase
MRALFEPFPVLECPRLILEKLSLNDIADISRLRSNPQNARFLARKPTMSVEEAQTWVECILAGMEAHNCLQWVIRLRSSRQFIGNVCLWNFSPDKKLAETGYELSPEFQGKGFMSEALDAVLELADRHGVETVEAFTHFDNESSLKLLKRHFFKLQEGQKDADDADNVIYRKTFHQKAREDQPEED